MERAKKPHLPYARHGVDDSDRRAVLSLFETTDSGTTPLLAQGTRVTDFEQSVKTFTGAKHAVACASGTAGLHAALQAIELSKNDVVITQAISFCATANAIRHCGATPLFADIDADKVGLCPRATREMLEWARRENKRVKAIMPVAMGGVAHASAELYALSREFGCYLIEDAAHALGANYDDADYDNSQNNNNAVGCGAYADITVFSTHAVKPITSGEGGIALTNDDKLARRMRQFCNHGIEREEKNFLASNLPKDRDRNRDRDGDRDGDRAKQGLHHYEMQSLGLNYRLSELQAALGASQMLRLAEKRDARRAIAEHYDFLLDTLLDIPLDMPLDIPLDMPFAKSNLLDVIQPLQRSARARSAHHLYLVEIDWRRLGMQRREFMQKLEQAGIGTQVHYIPIYEHPYYSKSKIDRCYYKPLPLERTARYAERTLSLPLFAEMRKEDAQYVVETIDRIYRQAKEGRDE